MQSAPWSVSSEHGAASAPSTVQRQAPSTLERQFPARYGSVPEHPTAKLFALGAEKDPAAADRQEEDARGGELIEDVLDLGERHFAVIVVIEVAVDAALVAALGQVERAPSGMPRRSALAPICCIKLMASLVVSDQSKMKIGDGL